MEALKSARAFDGAEAAKFAPARVDALEEDEGAAEAVVESVLRPKRSLWRRMVSAGLAIFGVSVVAQGVQWTMTAWQTQDWIALGGCAAGALIVGAGVGSVATEWRRLWRLRQRAHERDEARDLMHSHAVGKGRAFCEKLAQQAGLDQAHPRCSAGMRRFMKRKTTGKWSACMRNWCSQCWMPRRGGKSAVRRRSPR